MSSSYSTIHFGHYMAGAQDDLLACLNAQMAMIPAATGYSPNCWRHGLNVMLEKMPENIDVERLQIILLFEADCNQNNKWLGRVFMKISESAMNLLAREQYGSFRYKDATTTQCLNKKLWYDYIQWERKPAALCSNNAKSCYDRIVLLIAALCMCRLGASKPSVTVCLRLSMGCNTILKECMETLSALLAEQHGLNWSQELVKATEQGLQSGQWLVHHYLLL